MKKTYAQRYADLLKAGKTPTINVKFVCYPVSGTSASILIFEDTSAVTEADGKVLHVEDPNEKYLHHFQPVVGVNIDANNQRR